MLKIKCIIKPFFYLVYLDETKHARCKDRVQIPSPKNEQTRTQKAQNNKFIKSELENWVRMSWMANKVDSNDINKKVNGFQLKKVILRQVLGDQFLYIYLKYDYMIIS